jgi:hypothetical protein
VFEAAEPVGLRDGISRMVEWVRERGPQPPTPFPGEIEIREKLPPSWA